MRFDLEIIGEWIAPNSKVLDLGCGEGTLLKYLQEEKGVQGRGIELSEEKVVQCIKKGLSVLQGDINQEVTDYADNAFDYVILSQTLQQVYEPDRLIEELLRIGRRVVLSFPNFSHLSCRLQLLFKGRAPRTSELPYSWYNTPNIRVMTIRDFKDFSKERGFSIIRKAAINTNSPSSGGRINFLANLRATYGIFMIGRDSQGAEK